MVKKKDIVFIDSNVFLIDLKYTRDILAQTNKIFIDYILGNRIGMTSIINLLEICGILSFNLNGKQLLELYQYFPQRYNVGVIPDMNLNSPLPSLLVEMVFDTIKQKASFGDSLVVNMVNTYIPSISCFVSWDAEHFKNKFSVDVFTPAQFIEIYK
ncbi:MAG: hypothetical protein M1371_04365 [Actinobacteria bacterium]|nr:hypothetical protein [Actinomycetota bacterium]